MKHAILVNDLNFHLSLVYLTILKSIAALDKQRILVFKYTHIDINVHVNIY